MRRHRVLGATLAGGLLAVSVLGTTPVGAQDEVTLDFWTVGAMGLEELITRYAEDDPAVAVEQSPAASTSITRRSCPPSPPARSRTSRRSRTATAHSSRPTRRTSSTCARSAPRRSRATTCHGAGRRAWPLTAASSASRPTSGPRRSATARTSLRQPACRPLPTSSLRSGRIGTRSSRSASDSSRTATPRSSTRPTGRSSTSSRAREATSTTEATVASSTTRTPQVRKAFDTSLAGIAAGLSANTTQFTPEWIAGLADGDFAVLACPAWMMNVIQAQAPDTAGTWGIATIPEGGGNWGGGQLAIPARLRRPAGSL